MIDHLKRIYLFSVIVLNLILFLPVLLLQNFIAIIFSKSRADLSHTVATLWARSIFGMIPGWRLKVVGKENLPKKNKAFVYAVNHSSATDILAVYFIGNLQFRWLSKKEMFKYPIVGLAMRWCEYVAVDRGNKNSHIDALRSCSKLLEKKTPVLFFPEGTRSKDGVVKPFKLGAFKLAQEHNVPIVPVVIKGSKDLLKKGSLAFSRAKLEIQILPPTMKKEQEDIAEFAQRTRELIVSKYTEGSPA